jgi:hypothetical protein
MDFCDKHARVDPRAGEALRVHMTRPVGFGSLTLKIVGCARGRGSVAVDRRSDIALNLRRLVRVLEPFGERRTVT